ncbi:hypothetical protein N9L68_08495 [bacterium]|nr:hypothetical protein [bacterium]
MTSIGTDTDFLIGSLQRQASLGSLAATSQQQQQQQPSAISQQPQQPPASSSSSRCALDPRCREAAKRLQHCRWRHSSSSSSTCSFLIYAPNAPCPSRMLQLQLQQQQPAASSNSNSRSHNQPAPAPPPPDTISDTTKACMDVAREHLAG